MKEIRLHRSLKKSIFWVVIFGVFVGVGIFILVMGKGEHREAAWPILIFFGFNLLVALYLLSKNNSLIIINEKGIQHKVLQDQVLTWNAIKGADLIALYGNQFLSLEVAPDALPAHRQERLSRGIALLNKAVGIYEINIPLFQIGVNKKALKQLVNDLVKLDKRDRAARLRHFERQYLQ